MFDKQNIHVHYLKALGKIRSFLFSKKSREFLIFLFFAFVSFCFWLLQVLNDNYETELSIPLKMKNVPDNVVITSELPRNLKVGVKDRGTVLVNYLLGQTLYPITIDFEEYANKGSQVRIPVRSLEKRILSQLNQSTKLSIIKPDTLEYFYTKGEAKKIPVKLCGDIRAERQYYISSVSCTPDSVMVYAPREILDTLSAAYTEDVFEDGISDTLHRRIRIMPIKGARFVPSYSDVTFAVDMYSEKTVEVPISGVHFPADRIVRTFPAKVQVTFQVGVSRFKDVDADDFEVVVDYDELQKEKQEKCTLKLLRCPLNVNHVRINPQEIDYIIEQKTDIHD